MNPDTQITLEQLQAICAQHNIPYRSHNRITTGFSHEVHRLNDDLVIKIYNADSSQKFKTEAALLASDLAFPKAKFVAGGADQTIIDRSYIIMGYVPGGSLGNRWHLASDGQREALIQTISRSLQVINRADPLALGLEARESWNSVIGNRIERLTASLRDKDIIDAATAEAVRRTVRQRIETLDNSPLYPDYWDIHFDNFIVNEDFELQAIIDLENVELTPLDYPLFVIQKLTDEPEKYLREEDEKLANKADYAQLKAWYKTYYPQMFAFDNLDTRVGLYQLADTLHQLVDWPQVKSLYALLDRLTS